jgi:aldehyde:ferredoxin oxidoreductase
MIPPPGPRDNNTIWYDDATPALYNELYFGVGPTAGVAWKESDLEQVKDVYYRLAGCDVATGNPTPARLEELQLGWLNRENHAGPA